MAKDLEYVWGASDTMSRNAVNLLTQIIEMCLELPEQAIRLINLQLDDEETCWLATRLRQFGITKTKLFIDASNSQIRVSPTVKNREVLKDWVEAVRKVDFLYNQIDQGNLVDILPKLDEVSQEIDRQDRLPIFGIIIQESIPSIRKQAGFISEILLHLRWPTVVVLTQDTSIVIGVRS